MSAYASTVINAPADEVWDYLRDFGNLAEWLPGVTSCEIEGAGTSEPGAIRRVEGAGGLFRERLVVLDDASRTATYEIVECPLPVRDYRSTYRVAPVTDSGQSFVEWSAAFTSDDEARMTKIFTRGVFEPGLAALRKLF
ncbi:polyketide cyclase [Planobispora rosea]|uniref:Polyketide cyclase n=1 Tax=Planobispora rosea TaxID=35762 RepID=A0A8J3S9Z2_PLARO|nr:SRPBCC family protein [Planobispora rosea]GGS76952.1 polyketide cyclase [Planobispora rosea]GIH88731.1 polyketide cyclase [Planobispora rosea]